MKIGHFVFYLLTTFISNSECQESTFRSVTLLAENKIIATIHEGTDLKEFLPTYPLQTLTIIGTIPILYENSITDINNVKEIYFYNNKIGDIHPGAFKNVTGVNLLEIEYSDVTKIRRNTFSEVQMKKLTIRYNRKLETAEESAFDNPHIETLEVIANVITTLPKNIFQKMPNLKNLDLTGNLLSTIPPEFLSANLVRFCCAYNHVTSIPGGVFSHHCNLQEVDLSANSISSIDSDAFDVMSQLEVVNLAHNKLTKINPDWFYNSSKVNRLNFRDNLIEAIVDGAFKNVKDEIDEIDLSENRIKKISSGAFEAVTMIQSLILSMNEIEDWDGDFLQNVEKVYSLVLSGNQIKCPKGDFKEVFKAECTDLRLNTLDTECLMKIEGWMELGSFKGHIIL